MLTLIGVEPIVSADWRSEAERLGRRLSDGPANERGKEVLEDCAVDEVGLSMTWR